MISIGWRDRRVDEVSFVGSGTQEVQDSLGRPQSQSTFHQESITTGRDDSGERREVRQKG